MPLPTAGALHTTAVPPITEAPHIMGELLITEVPHNMAVPHTAEAGGQP